MEGLLGGVDLSDIQALLQQLGPSEQDKKDAKQRALLTAGLGMMQNAYMNPVRAIGYGGLLGANSYNQDLQQLGAQRSQNMAQVSQIMPVLQQMRWQKMMGQLSPQSAPQEQQAPTPYGQGMGGNFGIPQGQQSSLGGVMNDPSGNVPDVNLGAPPLAPSAGPQRPPGPMKTGIPMVDQALALGIPIGAIQSMSGPQELSKAIVEYAKPQNVRAQGSLVHRDQNGQVVLDYRAPVLAAGQTQDANQNAIDVPGAQEALFRQAMRPEVVKAQTKPVEQIVNGKPGFTGQTIADIVFPNGAPNVGQPGYTGRTQAAVDAGQLPPRGVKFADWQKAQAAAVNEPNAVAVPDNGKLANAVPLNQPSAIQPRNFTQTKLSPQETAQQQSYGDVLKSIDDKADAFQLAIPRLKTILSLADTVKPGEYNSVRQMFARIFTDVGGESESVNKFFGSASGNQIFGKNAGQLVQDQTAALGKGQAFAAMQQIAQNNANREMTPEAIKAVTKEMLAIANRGMHMQSEAHAFNDKGGNMQDFSNQYNKSYPLQFEPLSDLTMGKGNAAAAPPSRFPNGAVVALPNGQFKDFPSQQYADKFKAAAGLQ